MPGLIASASRLRGISAAEFETLMAPLGPFEPKPRVAVAVSGGPDSVALSLLIDRWVRRRGGTVFALTVDHGLRPESAAEAHKVARWMRARGIRHRIVRWHHGPIASRIQARARQARYALLTDWCRTHGVLHLALAHHRDDQAETVALRLARSSGPDGLAAMSRVVETADVRLLRPLLGCPRARLREFLTSRGQAWVEDPSNRDVRFARIQVRAMLDAEAIDGLVDTACRNGRERATRDDATAALLARAAVLHPFGYCVLDPIKLRAAPREVALRALSRVLLCVGGEPYPPKRVRLERLFDAAVGSEGGGKRRTLAGCLIVPSETLIHVMREARGLEPESAFRPGEKRLWDRRYHVSRAPGRQQPVEVAALGWAGWREVRLALDGAVPTFPLQVGLTLPGLWDAKGLRAVPHLGYERRRNAARGVRVEFRPAHPLAGATFSVV